jgi:hypothetical protein
MVTYFPMDDVIGDGSEKKNWFLFLLILLAFGIFSSGCAEYAKNVKDKCPECGTVFRVNNTPPGVRLSGY